MLIRILTAMMVVAATAAQAQVNASGSVTASAPFQSPVWDAGDVLSVGDSADGTLTIGSGSSVSAEVLFDGATDGTTGVVDVNGGNLDVDVFAAGIGADSTGILKVRNGATVTASVLGVGSGIDGVTGQVDVTGGSLTTDKVYLYLGHMSLSGGSVAVTDTLTVRTVYTPGSLDVTGGSFTAGNVDLGEGLISVSSGSLSITNNLSIVTLNKPGTLDISGTGSVSADMATLGGAFKLRDSGMFTTRVAIVAGGGVPMEVSGGNWVNSGAFLIGETDNGELTISGGNVTTPSVVLGVNSPSRGTLNLNGGVLTTGNVERAFTPPWPSGSGIVVFNGGTLRLSTDQSVLFFNFAPGSVTLAAGGGTIDTQGFSVATSYGLSGAGKLTKTGPGKLTLSGANTYTGGTKIAGGTLSVAADGNLGGAGGALALDGGTLQTTANFTTSRATTLGAGGGTFQTDKSLTHGGIISGTGGLTKTGAGRLTLTGDNIYTGATKVEAGTLVIDGSLAGTAVTVFDGATLGGSGTFGGHVTLASGATLTPGNSPGTLTFENGLTLDSGSMLHFELGFASDLILITSGTLTGPFDGGLVTLNLADSGGFTAGSYTLIAYSGAALDNFELSDFVFGNTMDGYIYSLDLVGSTLQLNAAAVPEPSIWGLLVAAVAFFLAAVRRRKPRHPAPRR